MIKVKIREHFFAGPRGRTEYKPGEEVEVSNADAELFVKNGQAALADDSAAAEKVADKVADAKAARRGGDK